MGKDMLGWITGNRYQKWYDEDLRKYHERFHAGTFPCSRCKKLMPPQ